LRKAQGTRDKAQEEGARHKVQGTRGNKPAIKKPEPQNEFQAKLAALKKKFDS